jgi:hypothetical protein
LEVSSWKKDIFTMVLIGVSLTNHLTGGFKNSPGFTGANTSNAAEQPATATTKQHNCSPHN